MTDSLTLAEAVPLGTVYLQRLLDEAGVRSLVIKGPAFVALGVRAERRSNDIDMIVHPDDRASATEALASVGWAIISHWFPPALDDVIYSTTFHHPHYPVTLDLHHRFTGMLAPPAVTFEVMWTRRGVVELAHHPVETVCREHAVVVEALNSMKMIEPQRWRAAVERVATLADEGDLLAILSAVEELGARHTASPLITALGGPAPTGPTPAGYDHWVRRGARNSGRGLVVDIIRRAPQHIPRVVWEQLTLDPTVARFWADTHRVVYRSRWQILWLRMRRAARR
ncbi:nucleotidyltransferase family protein [Janibacter cremeus]|uniref:Nucleotidyltransferase family protein n=1 Tax=Janibacter cremeus TaxID=1285192 RepID=A0A852VN83_9MICO|nr:hypothetical protein [Janibacter cremeus]